jgi:hypothetical protein
MNRLKELMKETTKAQQIKLLMELGIEKKNVPKYEINRCKLIVKLEKKKNEVEEVVEEVESKETCEEDKERVEEDKPEVVVRCKDEPPLCPTCLKTKKIEVEMKLLKDVKEERYRDYECEFSHKYTEYY